MDIYDGCLINEVFFDSTVMDKLKKVYEIQKGDSECFLLSEIVMIYWESLCFSKKNKYTLCLEDIKQFKLSYLIFDDKSIMEDRIRSLFYLFSKNHLFFLTRDHENNIDRFKLSSSNAISDSHLIDVFSENFSYLRVSQMFLDLSDADWRDPETVLNLQIVIDELDEMIQPDVVKLTKTLIKGIMSILLPNVSRESKEKRKLDA